MANVPFKTKVFLVFSGGTKWEHRPRMGKLVQNRAGFNPRNRAGFIYHRIFTRTKNITRAWFFITYTSYASY